MIKYRFVLKTFGFVLLLLLLGAVSLLIFSRGDMCNKPSYTALNRWYDSSERRLNISGYSPESDITLHTEIKPMAYSDPVIVIKCKNIALTVSTNGKILFKNSDNPFSKWVTYYNIIDVGDVSDGMVYINISPNKTVKSDLPLGAVMTTENDFIMNFIYENLGVFVLLFLLFALFSAFLVMAVIKESNYLFFWAVTLFGVSGLIACEKCIIQIFCGSITLVFFYKLISLILIVTALIGLIINKKLLYKL